MYIRAAKVIRHKRRMNFWREILQVKKVSLINFRNYVKAEAELDAQRNILIGNNAQGKTNFLEAIELISRGDSHRTSRDADFIRAGQDYLQLEIDFECEGINHKATLSMGRGTAGSGVVGKPPASGYEKSLKLNGISQTNNRSLKNHFVTVGFGSQDLNLLRGGPKYRRQWLDKVIESIQPGYRSTLSRYEKVIAQRNKLLKQIFDKGKLSVADNDQLKAWDDQLAKYGAAIIKERITAIIELLPAAEKYQQEISCAKESLSATYIFKSPEQKETASFEHDEQPEESEGCPQNIDAGDLMNKSESDIAAILLRLLKEARFDEIRRKQSLIGPHRDDIQLLLNAANAQRFASQGQQRSLVISLKLAELKRVKEALNEPPILLLDDVMAELDPHRQELILSLLADDMQTIITTTHISGFKQDWLASARFLSISDGQISAADG